MKKRKVKPKVWVVTMFQHGVPGLPDSQGEAQAWVKGRSLHSRIDLPGTSHGLFTNEESLIALTITGVGKANAATSIMSTGMHPEIDVSDAYVIVCGIAGANPNEVSVGSPVWCEAVVDGDLASFVSMPELGDARPFPFFPMGTTGQEDEEPYSSGTEVFVLNQALVSHAFRLTRDVDLLDDAPSADYRLAYQTKRAMRSPFVARGGFLSSDTFIHGHITGTWSESWFNRWAGPQHRYLLGNQEDSGTLTALRALSHMGMVQWDKILLLRAGSNYDRPAPGVTALESLKDAISNGVPVSMHIALENIYRVANRFIDSVV